MGVSRSVGVSITIDGFGDSNSFIQGRNSSLKLENNNTTSKRPSYIMKLIGPFIKMISNERKKIAKKEERTQFLKMLKDKFASGIEEERMAGIPTKILEDCLKNNKPNEENR
ncbi:hypothetical protein [Candidatus Fukatsuia endosymbiont of Tuberolachnus salignus]|uniref:hypothetical protein n=1 Tax=Candidatus Fukatsuia endosymbiont of Tuberolachnus salignus TaxID=3077957 RepID=UPI00313AD517